MMATMTPQQQIVMQMQQPQAMAGGGAGPGSALGASGPASWLGAAQSAGAAQGQTLKSVGGLVDENPKQAAMIVRDWLSNPA
jgi:flagellar M-ring protein FliF